MAEALPALQGISAAETALREPFVGEHTSGAQPPLQRPFLPHPQDALGSVRHEPEGRSALGYADVAIDGNGALPANLFPNEPL